MSEIDSKKELEILVDLQAIDSEINELKRIAAGLPEELNAHIAAYNEKEDMLTKVKKDIEDSQRQGRAKEREVSTSKDSLNKLNSKINEVKTNKEYTAILTEIDAVKGKITQLENEELSLMETQESLAASLKEKEQLLKNEKKILEERGKKNQADIAKIEKRLKDDSEKRKKIVEILDKDLYKNYLKISDSRGERVVVQYTAGACGGCFKSIIPQMIVQLRKNDTIINCPYCNRFLYWKEQGKQVR